MTLVPDVARFLATPAAQLGFPSDPGNDEAVAAFLARARAPRPLPPAEPVAAVWEADVDSSVRVRVYQCAGSGSHPVVVYFHGGGWVSGDLDMHDQTCRRICNVASCSVVNVDYRLAPEHPFPAAVDDAMAAVAWARRRCGDLDGDPDRFVVAGSSAGGAIAAAVCLKHRDLGLEQVAAQLLLYPALDSDMVSPSHAQHGRGLFLERPVMRWYWDQYVADPGQRRNPYASPAHAPSLAGLPPALVVTAEYDPLCDEAETYARRLVEDGGHAEVVRYDGQIHGFLALGAVLESAGPALDEIARRLADRLGTGGAR